MTKQDAIDQCGERQGIRPVGWEGCYFSRTNNQDIWAFAFGPNGYGMGLLSGYRDNDEWEVVSEDDRRRYTPWQDARLSPGAMFPQQEYLLKDGTIIPILPCGVSAFPIWR